MPSRHKASLVRGVPVISAGSFVYGKFFPGSALAARFNAPPASDLGAVASKAQTEVAAAAATAASSTPTFRDFVTTWLAEHQIEWRRSHIKVLNSTLNGHLLPTFGDKPVGAITKSDVLVFRSKLGEKPGRTGEKLSAKRINNILAVMRQVMADAADSHRFVSPLATVKPLKVRKSDVQPFTLEEVDRTCEGAILTANASDNSKARYGEGTTFFACLMPYQGGWGLNIVTTFSKASGAFSAATLAATLVRPLTGDSGQFIPRTIREIVEAIKAAGAEVTLVESYP
jgi:hypothetical protein